MSVYDLLQKENYMIGISSREREFLIEKHGGLWRYLDKAYPVTMVVRNVEKESYQQALSDNYPTVKLITGSDVSSLPDKRKILLQEAHQRGVEYLFMIDDDVALYFRDESLSSKYTSRAEDFDKMDAFDRILYESICLCDDIYPMVGLPLKQGSFNLKYTFPKNTPIIRFMCFHVPTLIKEKVDMTGLGTVNMSDRYVQLSLLEKGYATISNCRWCVGDPGTGYRGGCEKTRTVDTHNESAQALTRRFPKAVALKWKENGLWSERRLDCSIDWKYYLKEDEPRFVNVEAGLDKLRKHREGYDV